MFLILFSSLALASEHGLKLIHNADLDALMKGKGPVPIIYDVNVDSVRKSVGIIPGAKLLNSSSKYDVQKELPADKNAALIFYCANTLCGSSKEAAERAIKSGYKNVSDMVDGIYGWSKAGLPTQKITIKSTPIETKGNSGLTDEKSVVIVDVREDEERDEVISNALWMPMSKMDDAVAWGNFKKSLPKDKTIVFHCVRGIRAKKVADKLAAEGYKTSTFKNLDEGRAAGLKVIKRPVN